MLHRIALMTLITGLLVAGHAATATGADPADNTYTCNQQYVSIAAEPGVLVIGNCPQSTQVYRSWLSAPVTNNEGTFAYHGGYINGNFAACGWIRQDRGSFWGVRGRTNCLSGASRGIADFAYYTNCAPGQCQDGSYVTTTTACNAWGNVRPWVPGHVESDFMYQLPAGSGVMWRYVTVDNRFVLGRVTSKSPGQGNWAFLSTGCFNSAQFSHPADYPGGTNPYHVYWYH